MATTRSALDRFRIIQPHIENEVPLSSIAQECQISKRTLNHWVKIYRDVGLKGLERKHRSDKA